MNTALIGQLKIALNMKKSPSLASVANPIYERVHTVLHVLWSKSVGQLDYVKSEWTELEQAVQALAQEADGRSKGGSSAVASQNAGTINWIGG